MSETDREALERLRAARASAPPVETAQALARLESALFGAPTKKLVLDRYPLIRKLGQGGSGVVYLAHDPRLDRKVAIKLLSGSENAVHGTSEGRARLLREAQAMARSPHPNVVAVYDVGTFATGDEGEPAVFLVMEYAEGPDLRTWLTTPRTWREVLDVFIGAGRGLAAAHRVGVTHRDFKPANAIVGDDGRVRVLDFGLARGIGRDDDDTARWELDDAPTASLDSPLTVEGTVLGTPAFMAPEQHTGATCDATSDQYSFCVALWQGLYGEQPFAGRSIEALLQAKLNRPPVAPQGKPVPRWLADVLARGLQPDPAERWPSMDALLAALQRGIAGGKRRRWLAAGLVLPLALGAWALAPRAQAQCTGAPDRIASVWNAARRAEIEAAFLATGLGFAQSSADRVFERIDELRSQWVDEHRAACEATQVRHEQSVDLMDLRMGCLERQRREIDALLGVLAAADATTVEHAMTAAAGLPRSQACGDVDALLADLPPPSDPATAAVVEELRDEIARVKALEGAGRIPDALALAETIAARASEIDYAPVIAETTSLLGALQSASGRDFDAVRTLAAGHAAALACGHDRQAARAAQMLVFVHGDRLAQLDRALEWAEIAEAEIVRTDLDDERHALLAATASAYRAAGKMREAERSTRDALALLETSAHSDDAKVAMLHNNLGDMLRSLGDLSGAGEELELAHAIWQRVYGSEHPQIAMSLNNLGNLALARQEPARAEELYRDALGIRERALGPSHPLVATTLGNLGIALRRQGHLDEARTIYTRALSIVAPPGAAPDARAGGILNGLALIEAEARRFPEALTHIDAAIALWEETLPATHPDLGRALQNRAHVLLQMGEHAAAFTSFSRALALKEAAYGSGDRNVAIARLDFADVLNEVGAAAQATTFARAALENLAPDADPKLREEIEAWLRAAREP